MELFPDGKRLLVGGWANDDDPTWIVPIDGSKPTRARQAHAFALSPDGARVAFVRDGAVVVGDVEGGATVRVGSLATGEEALLAFAPTGDALALMRVDAAWMTGALEIVAADGSWTNAIVAAPGLMHTNQMRPTWIARDRVAYAVVLNDLETGIEEQPLDATFAPAGAPRLVWKGPLTAMSDLAFRAGRFFSGRNDSQRDVYVGRLSADAARLESPLTRFTNSDVNDSLAGWLPDGRILFTSLRDGKAHVYAQALGARSPRAHRGRQRDGRDRSPRRRHRGRDPARRDGQHGRGGAAGRSSARALLSRQHPVPFWSPRPLRARCSTLSPSRCVDQRPLRATRWTSSRSTPRRGRRLLPFAATTPRRRSTARSRRTARRCTCPTTTSSAS